MSEKDAFGFNLRRARLQRGVPLEKIARDTRIGIEHLEALEENDFTFWPHGIYARAWIRAYAEAVGLDPESTVDEFCRWFPNGDRRSERVLRQASDLLGHEFEAREDLAGTAHDRRGARREPGLAWLAWLSRIALWRRVPSRGASQEIS